MTALFPNYQRFNFEIVSGQSITLTDNKQKQYLDLTSGIGVCNLGYNHPIVKTAVQKQLNLIWHTSNLYQSSLQEEVASLLTNDNGSKVFFCNSGTEANEAAMKLARKATGKSKILAFDHSFHGRTYGALSLTDNPGIKKGFGPLVPEISFAEYNSPAALKQITTDLAAVILEIIQGEGGLKAADGDWLQAVQAKCHEKGVLLIIDEVQTGIGRTGKLFAYQHFNLDPDIVTSAKGLANGLPVGAMIGKEKLAAAFGPGSHGSTFGGNPLAMAAAKAVLETIDQAFLDDVSQKADFCWYYLQKEIAVLPMVTGISGRGLMIGIHLDPKIPVGKVIQQLQQAGVLTLSSRGNTLRLLPPLIITGSELMQGINIIKNVLETMTVH
ncbi:MAG: acetylornithine transaminase [Liquorilactobacillus nagelii]|jgi:acetylornithine aminotransferase|uniref:Acetylornithine aminotransferase n=1 Tax=Liquorilactobacillus nagelii TaxID=82688 RepID=A0A3Q8CVG2_9LACO|nr:acetylornithine transaminase [Liquorilactobacillus nagelii]AUJ32953.1 acetylornithine transaminase [Liquorilactobacillus nagelii]MCC7616295.1 acetylornithine transaminase [Liquorilactobacillus nagelii]MCI1633908.1 acetylornithine transaminase [Liquorilactobacillus nagelii]MCI1700838.1 acetylornithine transaminase [Liquorilactobacillus nagelii]MCP9315056.1 acetylornithine transaminase [Liquorilactobacillus nagelii]